ncbi:LysR family transcriptional regulator [Nocardia sp. NPDC051570]|uniref:LysR family transcriptional regulator n=1 Tax=Nocardia sp. NPDC051570 TaxID=3364324 RepID=UPI0037B18641
MAWEADGLDLEALRVLVRVADLGSISAAARAERISQPAASKRLRVLESRLRLELVDRRNRGSVLTAHGQMVTEWGRKVIAAADALITGAAALTEQARRNVSVGASQTIAEYLMPRWLTAFQEPASRPPVRLQVGSSPEIIAALRAREIDLGFIESPNVPADLGSRRVAKDRLVLVVSPHHQLARRCDPLTGLELARLRLVSRERGSAARETLELAVGEPLIDPVIELQSNAAVKVAVEAGELAAVLSELVVGQDLRDGRLVEIPLRGVDLTRCWHAVWRSGTRWQGAVGEFLTVVADQSRWT